MLSGDHLLATLFLQTKLIKTMWIDQIDPIDHIMVMSIKPLFRIILKVTNGKISEKIIKNIN